MASYDSDSSSDDSLDVQTNVTLGYATQEPTGDDISHVGGHPTWLDSDTKPAAALGRCKICNGYMSLLLQVQADLQQHFPGDDRRLFVWCCRKRQCTKKPGSVRAFREVKKAETSRKPEAKKQENNTPESKPQQSLGSQLFGGSPPPPSSNSNPFSTSSSQSQSNPLAASSHPNGATNPFSDLAAKPPQPPVQSFAEKLKIASPAPQDQKQKQKQEPSGPQDPWPSEALFPDPFPYFYLDAESEYLEPTPAANNTDPSNTRITDLDDDPSTSTSAEKDLYESPHDKTFSHFTALLSQNPEQILRYEFAGSPLLYSSTDMVSTHFVLPGHHLHQHQKIKTSGPTKGIPSCQHCGASRVFELQLVPYLIYELEKDDEEAMKLDGSRGMEWGTILVGSCSRNCGEEGRVVHNEEWVGVQWEEGGVELKQKK